MTNIWLWIEMVFLIVTRRAWTIIWMGEKCLKKVMDVEPRLEPMMRRLVVDCSSPPSSFSWWLDCASLLLWRSAQMHQSTLSDSFRLFPTVSTLSDCFNSFWLFDCSKIPRVGTSTNPSPSQVFDWYDT